MAHGMGRGLHGDSAFDAAARLHGARQEHPAAHAQDRRQKGARTNPAEGTFFFRCSLAFLK